MPWFKRSGLRLVLRLRSSVGASVGGVIHERDAVCCVAARVQLATAPTRARRTVAVTDLAAGHSDLLLAMPCGSDVFALSPFCHHVPRSCFCFRLVAPLAASGYNQDEPRQSRLPRPLQNPNVPAPHSPLRPSVPSLPVPPASLVLALSDSGHFAAAHRSTTLHHHPPPYLSIHLPDVLFAKQTPNLPPPSRPLLCNPYSPHLTHAAPARRLIICHHSARPSQTPNSRTSFARAREDVPSFLPAVELPPPLLTGRATHLRSSDIGVTNRLLSPSM